MKQAHNKQARWINTSEQHETVAYMYNKLREQRQLRVIRVATVGDKHVRNSRTPLTVTTLPLGTLTTGSMIARYHVISDTSLTICP